METIVAEATPHGRGGVGVVRISGPCAYEIGCKMSQQHLKPRYAELSTFVNKQGEVIDQGLALFFKGPNSFTGEDVVELQCHGGPVIIDQLLEAAIQFGTRLARPGEFSERAFLNDKIDLVQAEAISDLIAASTRESARAAVQSLQGEFSKQIKTLVERLIHLRVFIEATLDFPDEDIEFVQNAKVIEGLENIRSIFARIQAQAQTGVLLQEGIQIALIGKPNAGKSSLMNVLTGQDTAIVSEIAGTTRDVIREKIHLQGIPVHLVDTAGLRNSTDVIEQEGVRRTQKALQVADIILLVVDCQTPEDQHAILQEYAAELGGRSVITVFNKVDLLDSQSQSQYDRLEVSLSVKSGEGLDQLEAIILKQLNVQALGEGQFTARRRHLDALKQAEVSLNQGLELYQNSYSLELLAEECRIAQEALSSITGEFHSDDLLGAIFSTFCIGK